MPQACEALEVWDSAAGLVPGSPLFRSITKGGVISDARLTDGSIPRIIKSRVGAFAQARGKTKEEAADLVAAITGQFPTARLRHDGAAYR